MAMQEPVVSQLAELLGLTNPPVHHWPIMVGIEAFN
jgi:hypothetical protein